MTSTTAETPRARPPASSTRLSAALALLGTLALPYAASAQATANPQSASATPATPAAPAAPSRISVLLAQPPSSTPPTPEQDRQARAQFLQGRESFARGQFLDAAERFERAYELSRRAVLLYNLGTSYDRLHRWEEARDAFRRYVRDIPAAPEREEVNSRLTVIEQTIARETEMREAAIRAATATPRVVVVERDRDRIVYQPATEPRPFLIAGLVVGGLGVVSGLISTVVAIVANGEYNHLLEPGQCGASGTCPEDTVGLLAVRPGFVNGTLGGAIGLVAVGGVLLIVDARRHRRPAPPPAEAPANSPAGSAARRTARDHTPTLWWSVAPSADAQRVGLTFTGVL